MHSEELLIFSRNSEFIDSCGIGFIVETNGRKSRRVIEYSINALKRMSHRGAAGADEKTGDGIGIMVDIPHEFFDPILRDTFDYSGTTGYGIGMIFTYETEEDWLDQKIKNISSNLNIKIIGNRIVPNHPEALGKIAKNTKPIIIQYFFESLNENLLFEANLYLLRKKLEKEININSKFSFVCSLSSKTIVYKGLMNTHQLARFYDDINHPDFKTQFCIFHERFSTNTISTWDMAQPFRMIAHNGEINTIKGNRLWMEAREQNLKSDLWGDKIESLKPIVSMTGSDSYSLDNILEFLVHSGKNIIQSIMMLIPQPYQFDSEMENSLKDFYIFHENHIEPWDGPAAIIFTDGDILSAKLDRNGLRPLRYTITMDGLIVMASEAGVVDFDEENVIIHHHMKSGETFAFDLQKNIIIGNSEIIKSITKNGKYSELIASDLIRLSRGNNFEEFDEFAIPDGGFDQRLRIAFGFDKEDIEKFLIPMSQSGAESIGSMGDDTPPAAISNMNRKFYDYFKQYFAQVTNPPIDPIRERYVMSLHRYIGCEGNLLSEENTFSGSIRIESPILSPREVRLLKENYNWFPHKNIYAHFNDEETLRERLNKIKEESQHAVENGIRLLFLTDENIDELNKPIPMLLVVSTVHQHLVKMRIRNKCSLVCFTGDAVEDHHIACLIGFGASSVYPYMSYEILRELYKDDTWQIRLSNYRYALEKGLLKIMAKMGISTITSYHGSMAFHGIGLSNDFADEFFPYVKNSLGGITLGLLEERIKDRILKSFAESATIDEIGRFKFRKDGEAHAFAPSVFKEIQNISMGKDHKYTELSEPIYIRDFFAFNKREKISLELVENSTDIIRRFGLGAISFGAISEEVHRTLAKAASILNIRSNTGEGGEQKDRFSVSNPDKSENCYVKQIASGRFGVTTDYLTSAREIQIKMAQGAKPGEGGQLPAEKVTVSIANDRHTTPGVPLISPPPHHDIYSIEDIAQLIYDLKQVNPRAKICVKLVSQFGIGLVASGVVKAGADIVLISGNDGGTGASPLGSLKHTGLPWEIGLKEVHSVLTENGLRERVTLRVDGGIKSAKDIIIAAILGAEEFDFGTAALIALGCVMARQCHHNSCPVGIATQDEKLRKKFQGKPENLVKYLKHVSDDVRIFLSEMGYYGLNEIIGRYELLRIDDKYLKYLEDKNINLNEFIRPVNQRYSLILSKKYKLVEQNSFDHIDENIIEEIRTAIMTHGRATITRKVNNTDRAVGTRLSGVISFLYGSGGFKGNIQLKLFGSAGQSLGAFLVENIEIRHLGVANDFVGKGMSGGVIAISLPKKVVDLNLSPEKILGDGLESLTNTIIGNVALYGATGGEIYISGKAGERFAVRNSGAAAVVEGVGNHCAEYMTRGFIIVLGEIGKNLGAGMTGGYCFIYDNKENIQKNINSEYVRVEETSVSDEEIILRYIYNHHFHTNSEIAAKIISNWSDYKKRFHKITPIVLDIINFNKIYEEQYLNRKILVFNE